MILDERQKAVTMTTQAEKRQKGVIDIDISTMTDTVAVRNINSPTNKKSFIGEGRERQGVD